MISSYGGFMSVMGTAAKGLGSIMAGNSQAEQYRTFGMFAKEEGKEAVIKGKHQQHELLKEGHDIMAEQKAAYGEAGVTLEGTPMDILELTQQNIMRDVLMIGRETAIAERRAFLENKAYRKAARQAKQSGVMGAFSSLL